MDIKNLMSGIGVAIDDAFGPSNLAENDDKIFKLVKGLETEWQIPFYINHEIPSDDVCKNFLQSASFILLDWKLWPSNASNLEKDGIENNKRFLKRAKEYFVPVFIFTNENPEDIINAISPLDFYDEKNPRKNFIFVKSKSEMLDEFSSPIRDWLKENASVYTLKTWEQAFYEAKRNLFSAMYERTPDWPKVFWKAYKDDSVDPSSSMVNLINNNMLARMETRIFENEVLGKKPYAIDNTDIKSVLGGASFIPVEKLADDLKGGDIFKKDGKYFINIRADCDCIPRKKGQIINLFCIEGKFINSRQTKKLHEGGHFNERIWQSIVFGVDQGKSIEFDFRNFTQKPFEEMKDKRIGRLIHPYITRIQQRYAFYSQRQGLPRIPEEAIEVGDEG